MDLCIDINAYRTGIAQWIEYVRQQKEEQEEGGTKDARHER